MSEKKEVAGNVENIEIEAEKILKKARNKANEIITNANEEANKMLSSKLPMDEIKTECDQIIQKAREEADKKVKDSSEQASKIKTAVGKKTEKITKRIVDSIMGVEKE